MTKLLEESFEEAAKLSREDQDALAEWLLHELESERRWDRAFADSQEALAKLADSAVAEHKQGRTQPLEPDDL